MAALIAGMAAGTIVMRHRYQSAAIALAVNGVPITDDDIFIRMQSLDGRKALQQLIDDDLVLQYAKQRGLAPTEAEVAAESAKPANKPGLLRFLGVTGETTEDIQRAMRVQLCRLAIGTQGIAVLEADIRHFYDANANPKNPRARYYRPEMVQIAVYTAKTRAEIDSANEDLNRGIPFLTMVRSHHGGPNASNMGVLRPIFRGRTQFASVPGFENLVFDMKVGGTVGPRQFGGLWWLIYCLDKRPASSEKYEAVKQECTAGAKLAKGQAQNIRRIAPDFEAFAKKADIEVVWARYRNAIRTRGTAASAGL